MRAHTFFFALHLVLFLEAPNVTFYPTEVAKKQGMIMKMMSKGNGTSKSKSKGEGKGGGS